MTITAKVDMCRTPHKRRYDTYEDAEVSALRVPHASRIEVYRCPCEGWHLCHRTRSGSGHKKLKDSWKKRTRQRQKRDAAIEALGYKALRRWIVRVPPPENGTCPLPR